MPEKKNENKILSMLERTGFIRKDEPEVETKSANNRASLNDSDVKPIFDVSKNTSVPTPAAQQPARSSAPVRPERATVSIDAKAHLQSTHEEEPATASSPSTPVYDTASLEREYEEAVIVESTVDDAPLVVESSFEEVVIEEEPIVIEAPHPVGAPSVVPHEQAPSPYGEMSRYRSEYTQDDFSATERQQESYTDKFLNTEELYDALALKSKKTDSIYLIEEYLKTLPDSLPNTSRREIVNKLLAASEFDYDLLMGDGVLRVKMLKEYAERFAQHTDEYIASLQQQLDDYNQQIIRTQQLIDSRKELHKKQFFSIEAEAQRLKEILTFISG